MSNVDDELLVWVDDHLLEFNSPTTYRPPLADAPFFRAAAESQPEELGDTAPVGIGSQAASLEVSNLRVLRDILLRGEGPSWHARAGL